MGKRLIDIGNRIEELLLKHKMGRAELGLLLGVGAGAVGRYIRGEADAGAEALAKIADRFNVSIDWLVSGEQTKTYTMQYGGGKTYPSLKVITSLLEEAKQETKPNSKQAKILDQIKEETSAFLSKPYTPPFEPFDKKTNEPFDRDLLVEAAATIREAEISIGKNIPPDKLGEFIMLLYDDYIKGVKVEPARVIAMVRLVA